MGTAKTLDQTAVATMPRGGPDASWLDRRFETDALEYLDRDDVSDEVKQKVIRMLDRIGTLTNQHETFAQLALDVVGDIPNPVFWSWVRVTASCPPRSSNCTPRPRSQSPMWTPPRSPTSPRASSALTLGRTPR